MTNGRCNKPFLFLFFPCLVMAAVETVQGLKTRLRGAGNTIEITIGIFTPPALFPRDFNGV